MQLRNRLLALFCLLVFIGFGFLFFREWVVQKPFGIILFVSDGLTPANVTAARSFSRGADSRLELEKLPHSALVSNYANDLAIPDTAAAATAIATGVKTNSGSIGLSPGNGLLESILDLARRHGRSTGLVTTGNLTDPGAAAFFAHTPDISDTDGIATQLSGDQLPDVVLGGGKRDFLPVLKGGRRRDGRDLILELRDAGVDVIQSRPQLESLGGFRTSKLLGLFANAGLPFSDGGNAGANQPALADMVRRAIEFLQFNAGGYLLVVDAELVTRAAKANQGERALRETVALDEAIDIARRYAGEKSLVIAVGKHATGGMALNASPLREENGVGILGTNAFGVPAVSWATGPNGPKAADPAATPPAEPAAFYSSPALNSASDVIAVGVGDGTEKIKGFMDNTEFFSIIREKL